MVDRYQCAHCGSTGTCRNASDGKSCSVCVRQHRLEPEDNDPIVCSVCRGIGSVEPVSLGFQKHFTASLALVFVGLAFVVIFVFGVYVPEHFEKVLVFAGTLIGSITGFYFGGTQRFVRRPRSESPAVRSHDSGRQSVG